MANTFIQHITELLASNRLNIHVAENNHSEGSFFIDTFTIRYAGRITVWDNLAIHVHIITAAGGETVDDYHGDLDENPDLITVLNNYIELLRDDLM